MKNNLSLLVLCFAVVGCGSDHGSTNVTYNPSSQVDQLKGRKDIPEGQRQMIEKLYAKFPAAGAGSRPGPSGQ